MGCCCWALVLTIVFSSRSFLVFCAPSSVGGDEKFRSELRAVFQHTGYSVNSDKHLKELCRLEAVAISGKDDTKNLERFQATQAQFLRANSIVSALIEMPACKRPLSLKPNAKLREAPETLHQQISDDEVVCQMLVFATDAPKAIAARIEANRGGDSVWMREASDRFHKGLGELRSSIGKLWGQFANDAESHVLNGPGKATKAVSNTPNECAQQQQRQQRCPTTDQFEGIFRLLEKVAADGESVLFTALSMSHKPDWKKDKKDSEKHPKHTPSLAKFKNGEEFPATTIDRVLTTVFSNIRSSSPLHTTMTAKGEDHQQNRNEAELLAPQDAGATEKNVAASLMRSAFEKATSKLGKFADSVPGLRPTLQVKKRLDEFVLSHGSSLGVGYMAYMLASMFMSVRTGVQAFHDGNPVKGLVYAMFVAQYGYQLARTREKLVSRNKSVRSLDNKLQQFTRGLLDKLLAPSPISCAHKI